MIALTSQIISKKQSIESIYFAYTRAFRGLGMMLTPREYGLVMARLGIAGIVLLDLISSTVKDDILYERWGFHRGYIYMTSSVEDIALDIKYAIVSTLGASRRTTELAKMMQTDVDFEEDNIDIPVYYAANRTTT